MKKLQFICQKKGGAGKSFVMFLMAQKHPEASLIDMDNGARSTMQQLEYRKPKLIPLINDNNEIDRSQMSDFFESAASSKNNHFICDLGASVSEQLPHYIKDIHPEVLKELLTSLELDLEFVCVVTGGGSAFTSCLEYLKEVVTSIGNSFVVKVVLNQHNAFSPAEMEDIQTFIKAKKLPFQIINLRSGSQGTTERIRQVLVDGKGFEKSPAFTKVIFTNAVKELTL